MRAWNSTVDSLPRGTIWLAITVLNFAPTYVHLGDAGLVVLVLGSAAFAVITRPAVRLPQPAPAAPIPTATVVRGAGAPPMAPVCAARWHRWCPCRTPARAPSSECRPARSTRRRRRRSSRTWAIVCRPSVSAPRSPAARRCTFALPPELGDPDPILARIAEVAAAQDARRAATGARVLGRPEIRHQSWRECPTTREPRFGMRPQVAARNKWTRIEALQRNRHFLDAYLDARARWRAGLPVLFPAGTYWLRHFAFVAVAGSPKIPIVATAID